MYAVFITAPIFASSFRYEAVDRYLHEVKAVSSTSTADRTRTQALLARAGEVEKGMAEAVRVLQQQRLSLADAERDLARYIGINSAGPKGGLDPFEDPPQVAEISQAVTKTCCRLKLDKAAADQVFDNYSHDRPLLEGVRR